METFIHMAEWNCVSIKLHTNRNGPQSHFYQSPHGLALLYCYQSLTFRVLKILVQSFKRPCGKPSFHFQSLNLLLKKRFTYKHQANYSISIHCLFACFHRLSKYSLTYAVMSCSHLHMPSFWICTSYSSQKRLITFFPKISNIPPSGSSTSNTFPWILQRSTVN